VSASAALATRPWQVGSSWTVTLTIPPGVPGKGAVCTIEWDPSVPERLTPDELEQYRGGRNEALADVARELGIRIALVDL
jgi:hypothetical protein